jgi:hypothetical protein
MGLEHGLVINWANPKERGLRATKDKIMFAVITERPKGVRFNAIMSRRLLKHDVKFIKVGFAEFEDKRFLIIHPTYNQEEGFALTGNKHSMQVSAAVAYHWAQDNNLSHVVGKRIAGKWDEELGVYLFDASKVEDDTLEEVEDEE